VRGDEWLPTLPFHLQLFRALGFKPPKYLHIGPLMKMDGESKRKLSKRKDPELALTYYREAGFPVASVYEYLMTVLNSNFEDWRRANPDAPVDSFKFSYKKMNPAGSLFDAAKLRDVSKNVLSRMSTDRIYNEVVDYAKDYDTELYEHLTADEAYAKSILAIGRGGKKPRKDFAVLADVRPYLDFFYDDWFTVTDAYPEQFKNEDIRAALIAFKESYDEADDMNVWFDKIKALADSLGFASDMKAYKENPENYKGSVADVSMFLRVAVTGRMNSPDMYAVMHILGRLRVLARIDAMIDRLQ
jgi:glutamyl-tRNA synthetase